jgi:hypothetical protein
MSVRIAFPLVIAAACSIASASVESSRVPVPVVTTVDADVTGYGTFQSHNQKVVSTRYGIFMTYAKTPFDGALWRLVRSVDGGRTFEVVWEAVNSTHPPAIEAAADGTIYLVHGEQTTDAAYFYRLSPATSFAPEALATVGGAHAQKFSLLLDEARGTLYYAAYLGPNTRFLTLDLNGGVIADYLLTGGEQIARPSYPSMRLSAGILYMAWSSDKVVGDLNDYYSIHVVRSRDGGVTWQNLAGDALTPPFVGDPDGSTTEVTQAWERPCTTWLTAFAVTEHKAHFFYLVSPNASERACALARNVVRYQRFDLATGLRDMNTKEFAAGGVTFDNRRGYFLNGFFATSPRDGTLFLTSQTADNRLAIVASPDEGMTWRLVSQTEPLDDHLYAIGGQRQVTADGTIVGSFTDDSLHPAEEASAVRFLRHTAPVTSRERR